MSLLKVISLPAFLLFILCLSPEPANARQSSPTVTDFLLTAFEDRNLSQYDAQMNFLKRRNYRYPVLDEVEVRMGNDELTYEDLQYALRIRPNNPWKIRRNNAFFNATKKELSLRKQLEYKENMYLRYELALEYFYNKELRDLIRKQLELISRQSSIMEENLESELFDARDYADAKINQVEAIEDLDQAGIELEEASLRISLLLQTDNLNWDDFNLISLQEIETVAAQVAGSELSSSELELISQEMEVARQEVRLEKSDFDIGYAQFEYFPFTNRDSEYGFSVGLNIPIFKENKPAIAERKLDEIELQNEYNTVQYEDSIQKVRDYTHLLNLIEHHQLIAKQKQQLNLPSMTRNLAESEDYDPLVILDLQEAILNLDEILLKSRQRIYMQYLEFLFSYDVLTREPLLNYLSQDLNPIR